ncbi:MAG TPA: GNAT family N-acetyltransferase [Bacteroidales bacterium]|nr:GNAT family N-acetyltransferase [Bacteroidales bacterium]
MNRIRFSALQKEEMTRIKPLWEKLNQHHLALSPHFREYYEQFTFEKRMAKFQKAEKVIRLIVAEDTQSRKIVGYCLTSLQDDGAGEVESLFIEEAYRGNKIGEALLKDACKWLDEHKVTRKILGVAYGNTNAERFYKRCGFYPAYTVFATK